MTPLCRNICVAGGGAERDVCGMEMLLSSKFRISAMIYKCALEKALFKDKRGRGVA